MDVRNYNLEVLRDQVSMVISKMCCSQEASMTIFAGVMNMTSEEEVRRVCKLAQADGFAVSSRSTIQMIVQGGKQRIRRSEAASVYCKGSSLRNRRS